jgi:hypothetical protein
MLQHITRGPRISWLYIQCRVSKLVVTLFQFSHNSVLSESTYRNATLVPLCNIISQREYRAIKITTVGD